MAATAFALTKHPALLVLCRLCVLYLTGSLIVNTLLESDSTPRGCGSATLAQHVHISAVSCGRDIVYLYCIHTSTIYAVY